MARMEAWDEPDPKQASKPSSETRVHYDDIGKPVTAFVTSVENAGYAGPRLSFSEADKVPFKYDEFELLCELHDYLAGTYKGHYVGEDNIQAMDLIAGAGHGEGFCIGSILKYASRYGKKNGKNRADLLKIIHYVLFALWDKDKRGLK